LFTSIFESGIVNMFSDNFKWVNHDLHYEKDKVNLEGNFNDAKALSLGKKVRELFGLYLTLNIVAGGILMWEGIRKLVMTCRKRKRCNLKRNTSSNVIIVVTSYDM